MRNKLIALALALLLLSGCAPLVNPFADLFGTPSPEPELTPTSTPEPTAAPPRGSVFTDWSKLTPYAPPREHYTRLHAERMNELTPSDDYGLLLPFAGEMIVADIGWVAGTKSGLVTMDGMIVMDAVCSRINPLVPGEYYYESSACPVFYVLEKIFDNPQGVEDYEKWVRKYAVCGADGSWVTPFEYEYVDSCPLGALCTRDGEANSFEILDKNGKIIFDSAEFPVASLLDSYSSYRFSNFGVSRWILLQLKTDNCAFFDQEGNRLFSDECDGYFEWSSGFDGGYAVVCKGGKAGVIDEEARWVYPIEYDDITICSSPQSDGKRKLLGFLLSDGGIRRMVSPKGTTLFETSDYVYWMDHMNCFSGWIEGSDWFYRDLNYAPVTLNGSTDINPLYESGGYWAVFPEGCWLSYDGVERLIEGAVGINWISDGYIGWSDRDGNFFVQDLDGNIIDSFAETPDSYISVYIERDRLTGELYFVRYTDYYGKSYSYDVLSLSGELLATGFSWSYPPIVGGLFACNAGNLTGYKNTNNEWVFCVWVDPQD